MRADSLALDSPGQLLREVRGYGKAWLGGDVDSATKDRDWLRGDTVIAQLHAVRLRRQEARGAEPDRGPRAAPSRITSTATPKAPQRPSINYARGDAITVTMKNTAARRRRPGGHPGQGRRHPARGRGRFDLDAGPTALVPGSAADERPGMDRGARRPRPLGPDRRSPPSPGPPARATSRRSPIS